MTDHSLHTPRRIFAAGCVLGMAASVTIPWFSVSCALYTLCALVFGAGCFLARAVHPDFQTAWKISLLAAAVQLPGIFLTQYNIALLTTLMTAVMFYFLITRAVSGLAGALGLRPETRTPRKPPKAAVQFEAAASIYAMARLISDMMPALRVITDTAAMIALALGFVLVAQFVLRPAPPPAQ